jgi:hypothetical protein
LTTGQELAAQTTARWLDKRRFAMANWYLAQGPGNVGFETAGEGFTIGAQIGGSSVGIIAACNGPIGDGVQGNGTGNFSGIAGWGGTDSGTGVIGFGGGGAGPGVRGIGSGGPNTDPGGPAGVYGQGGNGAPGVIGQAGSGIADGVQGYGAGYFSGVAGFGGPDQGTGVFGFGGLSQGPGAFGGPGVRGIGGGGQNTVPTGVNGLVIAVGVYGQGAEAADGVYGVAGPGLSAEQSMGGVHGVGGAGSSEPGVLPGSYAGFFEGAVLITGSLSVLGTVTKGGGGFQIDHPLDPSNKYLVHSFVESPEMKNIYDGVAVADAAGEAGVVLPLYFDALNKDFRYQLTPIGGPAPGLHVKEELRGNRFVIGGAGPGQRVCWQITGSRKDDWANTNPMVVERDKRKVEKTRPQSAGAHARLRQ